MSNPSLTRLKVRWQTLRSRLKGAWQGLALRERRAVSLAALVVGSCLVWLVLIQPPLKTIAYWQAETPKLRSQTEALEVLLRDVGGPAQGQPVESALRQTLEASGLGEHYQLQAADPGNNAWQLTLQDAPADGAIDWLLSYPGRFSLEVIEARLQRTGPASSDDTDTAGTLSGTVRMDQAQGAKEAS
ncbi:general secretion pathway protein M [Pseudomonas sp. NFACC32-1]|uniref:type II secretion system protein GspM n=1 Tax=unclassified Pseudomonas TaxID=196821 RepID=UPI000875F7CC|nr:MULTISPECIES: type II secretion system protein GspM [unclassified Pseudomonas]MDB6442795.1 type II secretion system protein GspM [Pseudomonas sp. 21TX0197]ROO39580.1 general secretion pathway protein GspM [Pseudomonas sp. AF76]SCX67044.1 general secretion pathway protein M [Pseudomonas sp. NFACC32-1]SFX67043.1 general secretion pathway protein M [Pseudomonas sp. NFACC49-2]SFX92443.1 general secretion pathway protein M [Pseudomonas sp. NFACC36]